MSLPDFLIIGAARSGTTALARILQQHPEIFLSTPKEPHFLAFANQALDFRGPGDDGMINRVAMTDPKQFAELFSAAKPGAKRGEGSVSTLYYHQHSIGNIQQYCPRAKLIVILRNPVERAFSSYLYMVSRGHETLPTFAEALDDEPRRIAANWHHIWHYTRLGMYSEQITAFQQVFPTEQLKVLLFDDLAERPQQVARELYEWLDVEPNFRPDASIPVNRSGVPKNQAIHAALQRLQQLPRTKSLLKHLVPWKLRERLRSANLAHPKIDSQSAGRLAEVYRDELLRLEEVLGRDLSIWNGERRLETASSGM